MLSHSAWPHRLSPSAYLTAETATVLAHAQSEESGIEPGQIATITGSLASLPEEHYDTDHTDLGSETDEAEFRRELLRDVSLRRRRTSKLARAAIFNPYVGQL